jgi:quinol-cytochrome oxidoreductase complex cytochrome b subunit
VLGGEAYNERTLARFYVVHAAVLPTLLALLVVVHIAIVRLQGVSPLRFAGDPPEQTFRLYPDHVYTELVVGLLLMVLLSTLAVVFPATLGPKADPASTPELIEPEWFFYVAFRWLKLFSGTVALLGLGLVLFLMFAWPLVDAWARRRLPDAETSMWVGAAAVIAIVSLTVWEAVAAH